MACPILRYTPAKREASPKPGRAFDSGKYSRYHDSKSPAEHAGKEEGEHQAKEANDSSIIKLDQLNKEV
jgi:hypothetical protein